MLNCVRITELIGPPKDSFFNDFALSSFVGIAPRWWNKQAIPRHQVPTLISQTWTVLYVHSTEQGCLRDAIHQCHLEPVLQLGEEGMSRVTPSHHL